MREKPGPVPAGMAIDALLDARHRSDDHREIAAIDELLARISHRRRLTAAEAIVVGFQLSAAERQFSRLDRTDPGRRLRRRRRAAQPALH